MKKRTKIFATVLMSAMLALAVCAFAACDEPPAPEPEPEVVSLEITSPPSKVDYYIGEELDLSGIRLYAIWSDGVSQKVNVSACKVSKTGYIEAGDREISFTYEGKTAKQTINVNPATVTELRIDRGAFAEKGSTGVMDLTMANVTAVFSDSAEKKVGGWTVTANGEPVADPANAYIETKGNYVFEYSFGGAKASFEMEVFHGFMIEAENIDLTEPADKKNYVGGEGSFKGCRGQYGADKSSGQAYMGDIAYGHKIRFHIWSDETEAREAHLILRAASSWLTDGGADKWTPLEMSAMQFNKTFTVKFGEQTIEVPDECILEGGKTKYEGQRDDDLWANWTDVNFGTVLLQPGDNVIELTVISEYVNAAGIRCACNIDRLEIEWADTEPAPEPEPEPAIPGEDEKEEEI